jgi:hypothetical protein
LRMLALSVNETGAYGQETWRRPINWPVRTRRSF